MEKGFAAESLRELRTRAGLTQKELAGWSGVSRIAICYIEQGKSKPRELTWRKLLKAISTVMAEKEERREKESASIFVGEALTREEFFARLKTKMRESLVGFCNEPLIRALLEGAEFFSRQRYYLGDFATAVELLGALYRAQREPTSVEGDPPATRRRCRR